MAPRTRLDDEVLGLLADDPELLAIADAFAETQAHRRRVRPLGVAAAGVAVVFVVALALTFWPGGGSSGISGNTAYAAIGGASRVLEIRALGDARPFGLRLDRETRQLVATDRAGALRVPADALPPASAQLPTSLTSRFGPSVGPVLSVLAEYPGIARSGHLDVVAAPEPRYRALRWISYRSVLGYAVEVGLEPGLLRPIAVVRAGRDDVRSIAVSSTN